MDKAMKNTIPPNDQAGVFTIFDALRLLVHMVCGIAGLMVGFNNFGFLGGTIGLILGLTALGLIAYLGISFLLAFILKIAIGGPFFTPKAD